jgi:type VI protein secretion system component VasK
MAKEERESPNRQRRRRWLERGLRALMVLALVAIVLRFVWVRFVRGSAMSGVIQGVQELAPQAEKRNQALRDLTLPPAGNPDKQGATK